MATPLYLLSTVAEVNPGAEDERALSLTRGSGVVSSDATATVAGPTAGVQVKLGGVVASWISPPLAAVTISGTVTFNLWGLESATTANTGFDVLVERVNNAGTVQSTIVRSERGTELAGSAAVNTWTAAPTSTALTVGDRIKVTVFGNDAGGTMASGRTFTLTYNGTSAAANGDSYVQFTETLAVTCLGTLAATQAAHTLSSAGTVAIAGTASITQSDQTLSSSGTVAIAGTASIPQAAHTLSSVGTVAVAGTASITQAAQTLSSAGTVKITGTLAATQAAQSLSSTGAVAIAGTLPDSSLLTDLIAYWTLDEASGTRVDSTGRGNDLSPMNAPGSTAGVVGDAARFTRASRQALTRADNADLKAGNIDFTWAFWVYLRSKATGYALVDKEDLVGGLSDYAIVYNQSGDYFEFDAGSANVNAVTLGSPSIDTWYFITADYRASDHRLRISVSNGAFDTQIGFDANVAGDSTFAIGGLVAYDFGYATADIDEVGFWKRLLTDDEHTYLAEGHTYPFRSGAAQADQTVSSSGTVAVAGTLASTQDDQSVSGTAAVAIAGTLALAQADQSLAASGTVEKAEVVGTLAATQVDQSLSASGTVTSTVAVPPGAGVTSSHRKRVFFLPRSPLTGALARTQSGNALASSGTVAIAGTLAATQADQTSGGSGTIAGIGTLARTQHAQRLSGSGTVGIVGRLGALQAGATLASAGAVAIVGSLARPQRGHRLMARGTVVGDVSDDLVLLGLEPEDEELLLLA